MATKTHSIRHRSGDLIVVDEYTRRKAIRAICTECMGFEGNPRDCEEIGCALFPFRGKINDTVTLKKKWREKSV